MTKSVVIDCIPNINDILKLAHRRYGVLLIVLPCLLMKSVSAASEGFVLEDMTLLALSVADAQGVVKLPSGRLITVAPGERLPQLQAVVVEVLHDRLVLELDLPAGSSIQEKVWLYKQAPSEHQPRLRRLGRIPPPQPSILMPMSQSVQILTEGGMPDP